MAAVDLADAGDGGVLTLSNGVKKGVVFRDGFQQGKKLFHSRLQTAMRKGGRIPPFREDVTRYFLMCISA